MFDITVRNAEGLKNTLSISGTGQYSITYNDVEFSTGTLPAIVNMPTDLNGDIKKGFYNVKIGNALYVFEYTYEHVELSVGVTVNGFLSSIRIDDTTDYTGITVLSKTLSVTEPQGVNTDDTDSFVKTNIYSGKWEYTLTSNVKQSFPSNLTVYDRLSLSGYRNILNITKDNVFEASNAFFEEYRDAVKTNSFVSDRMENDAISINGYLNSFYRHLLSHDAQSAYYCLESIALIVSIPLTTELIVPFSFDIGSDVDTYMSKLTASDTPRWIGDMLGASLEIVNNRIESKGSGKVSIGGEPVAYLEEKIDNSTIKTDGNKIYADITYTNLLPVPEKALGIDAGTTFDKVPIPNVLDMLIYQYAYPIINLSSPVNRILEVGQSVSGTTPVTWSIQNKPNVKTGGYKMIYLPSSTEVFAETDINATTGTFTHPLTVKNLASTLNVFKFYLTDTKGTERSVTVQYTWNHRIYFGESASASLGESGIKSLRVSNIYASFLGKYQTNKGGYKYICVPADMGVPTRFRDVATGLLVPFNDPVSVQVTNQYGVSLQYNVFRTSNVLGGAVNIEIY